MNLTVKDLPKAILYFAGLAAIVLVSMSLIAIALMVLLLFSLITWAISKVATAGMSTGI
jgi:hypothetical protein